MYAAHVPALATGETGHVDSTRSERGGESVTSTISEAGRSVMRAESAGHRERATSAAFTPFAQRCSLAHTLSRSRPALRGRV